MRKTHTPAPWSCSNEGWGDGMADVRGPEREDVCRLFMTTDCPSGSGFIINENYDADRALILAAPDLLVALENLLSATDLIQARQVGPTKINQAIMALRSS